MKLTYFHSHYPLICKEGIIYSQALQYNMTLSKDHTLQKELNNHTSIFLTRAYALILIIKNVKIHHLYWQWFVFWTGTTYVNPFWDTGKLFTNIIHENCYDAMLSIIWQFKPLFIYTKSSIIHNHLVYFTQTYGSLQHKL